MASLPTESNKRGIQVPFQGLLLNLSIKATIPHFFRIVAIGEDYSIISGFNINVIFQKRPLDLCPTIICAFSKKF